VFECHCSNALVRMPLFECHCSNALVRMPLFECTCSNAIVRMHLFECHCSNALVRMHLFERISHERQGPERAAETQRGGASLPRPAAAPAAPSTVA